MAIENRIKAFVELGNFLDQFQVDGIIKKEELPLNDLFFDAFSLQINRAIETNGIIIFERFFMMFHFNV